METLFTPFFSCLTVFRKETALAFGKVASARQSNLVFVHVFTATVPIISGYSFVLCLHSLCLKNINKDAKIIFLHQASEDEEKGFAIAYFISNTFLNR